MSNEEAFVNELIGYIFAYPNDDYMTMECLCRKLYKHGLIDKKDGEWTCNFIEITETEIAKGIVHKMIDDAVIAEDAYPDLRQKMHDAVDEYEPQTERFDSTHDPHKEWTDCPWK